jgi:hypothetical protein
VVDPAAVNAPDVTETSNESGITVESIDANPILEKMSVPITTARSNLRALR